MSDEFSSLSADRHEDADEESVRVPASDVSTVINGIEPIISTAFITHYALGSKESGGYYLLPLEEWVMFGDDDEKILSRRVPLDNLIFTIRNITSGVEDSMRSLKELSLGTAKLATSQKVRMDDWLAKAEANLKSARETLAQVDSHTEA